MSDVKISALPAAAPVDGTEIVPLVQATTTKQTSLSAINTWISGQLQALYSGISTAFQGAGAVGFLYSLAYGAGTVGKKLTEIASPQDSGGLVNGVTDDTAALAAMTARVHPFVVSGKSTYQYGAIGPVLGAANRIDYATIGAAEILTNGGFTGSSANWALTNFAYSANTITHAAGTAGQATQAISLKAFRHYMLSVTLTTTARGGVDFQFNGLTMLDDTGFYMFDPATNTYTFPFLSGAAATSNFSVVTDAAWAGSIDTVSLIEVADEMPLSFVSVPTDDAQLRLPNGLKFGRYNAGVIALGDRQTMALGGQAAVWNVAIGPRTLQGNLTAFENTAVGAFAGRYTTTPRNSFFGYAAGKYNTLGVDLTFLGYKAGGSNTTGVRNDAYGKHALLQNSSGSDNHGAGYQALYNVLNTNGNTSVGSQSALNCRGSENTYVGVLAGQLNADANVTYTYSFGVTVGAEAKVYGDNNTAVGFQTQIGADGAPNINSVVIGKGAAVKADNAVKVGAGTLTFVTPGRTSSYEVSTSDGTAAGITYSTAQFVRSTVFTRSGPGAPFNDTTPTAAAIVAAMPGAEVNTGYEIWVRNTSGFALTLVGGLGVTLGGNTTISANQTRFYKVYATNVGSGTEAVIVIGVCTAPI